MRQGNGEEEGTDGGGEGEGEKVDKGEKRRDMERRGEEGRGRQGVGESSESRTSLELHGGPNTGTQMHNLDSQFI